MKKILLVVLAFVMVFSLAACGGNNAGTTNSGGNSGNGDSTGGSTDNSGSTNNGGGEAEPVELDVWLFGTTGYEELAEEYKQANPHVSFNFTVGEMNDHHDQLFATISQGQGAPDIAMIEIGSIERFREAQDSFYNLYDFGAADIKDKYLDWKWNLGESADGSHLLGFPTDIAPTAMYYRADLFEQAGLPTDPAEVEAAIDSWEKFRSVAKDFKASTGKYFVDSAELVYNALRDQADQKYFNTNEELLIESNEQIKKAYDFATGMVADGTVAPNSLWTPEWGNGQAAGDYAVMLAPTWMKWPISGNAPDVTSWRVAQMPEGAGAWGGSYLSIPKESDSPEEAAKFLTWLVAPEQQIKSFKANGLFPSTPEVYDAPAFADFKDDYHGGQNTAEVFKKAAEKIKPYYAGKNFQVVQSEITNALLNVVNNDADPQAEWDAAVKRIKDILARQ
jgi:cellobiose transport system substrate-binding protein